jgi:hypothetical protein
MNAYATLWHYLYSETKLWSTFCVRPASFVEFLGMLHASPCLYEKMIKTVWSNTVADEKNPDREVSKQRRANLTVHHGSSYKNSSCTSAN